MVEVSLIDLVGRTEQLEQEHVHFVTWRFEFDQELNLMDACANEGKDELSEIACH